MNYERFLSGNDFKSETRAIEHTRKIRDAATRDPSDMPKPLPKPIAAFLRRNPQEHVILPDEALRDAEELALATASFMIALSSNESQQAERDRIQTLLGEYSVKYKPFWAFSVYKTPNQKATDLYERDFVDFQNFWDSNEQIFPVVVKANSIQRTDFTNQDLGVFSPLATDYLTAATYAEYIRANGQVPFDVLPVAVNRDLDSLFIANDEDNKQPFAGKRSLGIFMNILSSGRTTEFIYDALEEGYPGKPIIVMALHQD